ncbi:retrovirus-related pol polyprotein from transposon TNT 1-94 [Tanacetum coccineum]|uniref:Retrovirus-related pol polyprotein from transposon TNT 1-94 n=1 Tax=Tanacetum coccineum TaxID=301880 RepID=A0ABQ5AKR6_9ASTR
MVTMGCYVKVQQSRYRKRSNSRNKTEDTIPSFMAKIQEVLPEESSSIEQPLEQVQNHDENNVFANERRHSEQPESINDTYVLEKDDSNVTPDSSNICNNKSVDQNAAECADERAALANLIANLTLDTEENKMILKQLKKANASLTQELEECKTNLDETSRALGEATRSTKPLMTGRLIMTFFKQILNQKHDELVKKSLLTKSQLEGRLKEKTKVILDLKVKEEKDIDKMIEMDKQLKFLNEIVYTRNQSIQTIHMLAPKCSTYNRRPTFANPREETMTLANESRSKLNKDYVKPYDYTKQNSLYEIFKAPSMEYLYKLERAKEVRKTMWRKPFEWKWWIAKTCPSGYTWTQKPLRTKKIWMPKIKKDDVSTSISPTIDIVSRITNIVQLILFIVDSGCTKHMTGNLKLLCIFVEKFLGSVTIQSVYYVEGLITSFLSLVNSVMRIGVAFRNLLFCRDDLPGKRFTNCVVERQNRTLVEDARTMLSASKLPLSFWTEVVATACYTQTDQSSYSTPCKDGARRQGQKASDYDNSDPRCPKTKCCSYSKKRQIRHNKGWNFSSVLYFKNIRKRGKAIPAHGHAEDNTMIKHRNASFQELNIQSFVTRLELVDKPFGKMIIKAKKVMEEPRRMRSDSIRNKARLVAKGCAQKRSVVRGCMRLLWLAKNNATYSAFEKLMHSRFEMSLMGEMKFFLGLQIHQSPKGIFINQAKYALEILKKYNMDNCHSIVTPLDTKHKLDVDLSGEPVDQSDYRSKIGSLMYLTSSRPDLVQYVAIMHDSGFELTAFSDVDHAGCLDTQKKQFGGIKLNGDKLVSWMFKENIMHCTCLIAEAGVLGVFCSCRSNARYQLADMFTKALLEDRFKYLVRRIGMRCLTPADLEVLSNKTA